MTGTVQPEARVRPSLVVPLLPVPRLRYWRQRRSLSQEELEKASGVSRSTIIKLEKDRPAWPKTIRKLAAALHVKPDELLALSDPADKVDSR